MNKGQKILLIIAGALVAIAGIVYWLIAEVRTPAQPSTPTADQVKPVVPVEKPVTFTPPPMSNGERERATMQNIVMAFAERFGTYSNQNGGFDASLLKSVVTASFYQWLSATYTAQLTRDYPKSTAYAGISTDAVSVEFKTVTDTAATVVVASNQTVQKGTDPITNTRQLQIALVKSDAGWKIDGAYWLKP